MWNDGEGSLKSGRQRRGSVENMKAAVGCTVDAVIRP